MMQYDQNGLTEQAFLAQYNPGDFPRPSVTVDMVIFTIDSAPQQNYRKLPQKELRVLLIRRGVHPYLGQWALPGGFVRPTETVGAAANRELYEEAGVKSGYLEQLYTFSEPSRDPRTWVISCAHMALINSKEHQLKAGDDACDARWFHLTCNQIENGHGLYQCYELKLMADDRILTAVVGLKNDQQDTEFQILENDGLAFDHAKMIACAVRRLQGKLEQTDLALSLMPEKFTLSELQQVYEVILGRPLLKAAFRRKIKDLVQETGDYTENEGHRPSQLFRKAEKTTL